ncbi:MAG: DUF3394 domain-containing protein, partial [Aeromonas sp.]
AQLAQTMGDVEAESTLRLQILGEDAVGKPRKFTLLVAVPDGADGKERLANLGLSLYEQDGKTLIDNVAFNSPAANMGLEFDQQILAIKAPTDRWRKELMWIPGFLLFGIIIWLQRRRIKPI